jgi:hypothetical protein
MDYLRRMRLSGVQDAVINCGVVHHQSQTIKVFTPQQSHIHNQRFVLAQTNYMMKWAGAPDWAQLREVGGHGKTNEISFIVATTGRAGLQRTLNSIEMWPGDELIVIGNMGAAVDARAKFISHAPCGDWGHTERNVAMPLAKGRYLAHIDDDDFYVPGTRGMMANAMETHPDKPTLFRMQFPSGLRLWQNRELRCGNLGTPMMLVPNTPGKLGVWAPYVGGDFEFLRGCGWQAEDFLWREEVIALLGHNIGS